MRSRDSGGCCGLFLLIVLVVAVLGGIGLIWATLEYKPASDPAPKAPKLKQW